MKEFPRCKTMFLTFSMKSHSLKVSGNFLTNATVLNQAYKCSIVMSEPLQMDVA